MFHFPKSRLYENMFLLFSVPIRGWDGLYRIEETKFVCAISRKFILVENHILGAYGILKWIQNGTKINPNWAQTGPKVWTIFVPMFFWDVLGFLALNGPLTSLKHPLTAASSVVRLGGSCSVSASGACRLMLAVPLVGFVDLVRTLGACNRFKN